MNNPKVTRKSFFVLVTLIGMFSLSFIFAAFSPSYSWHTADEILISVPGCAITLQEAINNGFLKDGGQVPTENCVASLLVGHSATEIDIYLGESNNNAHVGQVSLQDAISNSNNFCREHSSSFSNILSGHLSSAIKVNISGEEFSFQELIDSTKFCSYLWKISDWSGWDGDCGTVTKTRSVSCERSDGKTEGVVDKDCVDDDRGVKPNVSESSELAACPTCSDGIPNQGEDEIDCGGPCTACIPPSPPVSVTAAGGHTLECRSSGWTYVGGNTWKCNDPQVYGPIVYAIFGNAPPFRNWDGAKGWSQIATPAGTKNSPYYWCSAFGTIDSSSYSGGSSMTFAIFNPGTRLSTCVANRWCITNYAKSSNTAGWGTISVSGSITCEFSGSF